MRPLVRTLAVLAATASLLTIGPPAMATGTFIGGGVGDCESFAFYGTGDFNHTTHPPKLLQIDVADACADALYVFVTASDGTLTSMGVAPGVTTTIGPGDLARAGLVAVEVISVGAGQTTDVNDPCDLNTTYIVQPDGALAPRSTVC